jgi:hypothetical protein
MLANRWRIRLGAFTGIGSIPANSKNGIIELCYSCMQSKLAPQYLHLRIRLTCTLSQTGLQSLLSCLAQQRLCCSCFRSRLRILMDRYLRKTNLEETVSTSNQMECLQDMLPV